MIVIKNRMRDLRKKKNIGQSELADRIGVCRETIYRLENDKFEGPSYKLVFQIAGFFGEPVENVFTFVEEGQEPEWNNI